MSAVTRHVVTFNVNQHDNPKEVAEDLEIRMQGADVVILQELVNFDLGAFADTQPGWTAHQLDAGDNNGHANTAILYRTALGPVQDSVCIFLGRAKDTRDRFLIGVQLGGVWYVALHIFPRRDRRKIPAQLVQVGQWVHETPGPKVIGLDRNQCSIADLEHATGLVWHGVDIDGFLTNLAAAQVAEFPKGHSDHKGVRATLTVPAAKPHLVLVTAPSPEMVGPSPHIMHDANDHPLENLPLTRIVIHCTVSPCVAGGRYTIAKIFNNPAGRTASAHYIVDPEAAVQDVGDSKVAEHAPPNPHSIGIELCDPLISQAWDKAHAGRWNDALHQSMLHRAARITARLALAYGVPIHKLTVAELKAGKHGICGHVDVSNAFHETTHWDPGPAFPWVEFLDRVQKRAEHLKAG